jgi:C-terminal processing protease CtpA/Prc
MAFAFRGVPRESWIAAHPKAYVVQIGSIAITLARKVTPAAGRVRSLHVLLRLPMMTLRSLLLAALVLGAPLATASAQSTLANPGFEEGAPSLTGWHFREMGTFSFALDSADAHEGRWAARLTGQGGAPPGAFGNLLQRMDAAPYRGQRVRYRAWVRTDLPAGANRAGIWMRVDRAGGGVGFFDNMEARPITGRTGWRQYEITGDVAPDAQAVYLGALLIGQGQVWMDAASLEAGPSMAAPEAARPVTERGLTNLVAFSRLMGYVRWFHPSDAAAGTNWDAFALAGVRAVEGAPDARRLAAVLDSLFRPVAPALAVRAGDAAEAEVARPAGDSLRVVWWRHFGVGLGGPRSTYRSDRIRADADALPDSAPDPRRPLRVDLGGGVSASIPLSLYADTEGTFPRAPAPSAADPLALPVFSGDDRGTRLAVVALGWNVFQHFYPYFDVSDADWPTELPRALRAAATDAGECAFLVTLRRMVAALDDGHGLVVHPCERGQRSAPVAVEIVEGRPTVVGVAPSAEGVRLGDVVLRVDGAPADSILRAWGELTSAATPGWRASVVAERLLTGRDSLVRLTVQHVDGDTATLTVGRMAGPALPPGAKPEPVAQLRPGIWYVDLDRVTTPQFQAALPDLERAAGLVFDLRGYPDGFDPFQFFSHLMREPGTSARWTIPVATRPDRADVRFEQRPGWTLTPAAPHLAAPRVFITNGSAISFAESMMGIVEAYRLGEIVGGTTAGTNGNVNPLALPGGYRIGWTGMRVLKHDGSRHHGVGIRPTVPVERTRAGVAAGRDELLERALEVVARAPARP